MSAAPKLHPNLVLAESLLQPQLKRNVKLLEFGQAFDPALRPSTIYIGQSPEPVAILESCLRSRVTHYCNEGNPSFASDINSSALMIQHNQIFLSNPLGAIFHAQVATADSGCLVPNKFWDFQKASDKIPILSELDAYVHGLGRSQLLQTDVRGVADELFTNAVYNAPFIDVQTQINPGKDRADNSIRMPPGKFARLYIGHDDHRLVVGCQDPFGSLNLFTLMQKIVLCYQSGLGSAMNFGAGGAGIGSYMVFNASTSYYAAVMAGVTTMIFCSIPLRMSGKRRAECPHNLSLIQINGGHKDGTI